MTEEIIDNKDLRISNNFLKFKTLRFKNIMSFGENITEIKLDTNSSTIISGKNGNGKSTIVEALVFSLFGKPFRNINKPQLINNINKSGLYTEIEFSAGGHDYLVKRGLKPTLFEIYRDGNLIDQNAGMSDYQEYLENNIMRMSYRAFIQIVVIGNASYVQFMQLKPPQRREVVEQLLNLKIFTVMSEILKEKVSDNKKNVDLIRVKINSCEDKISFIEDKMKSFFEINKIDVVDTKNQIEKLDSEIQALQEESKTFLEEYTELFNKNHLIEIEYSEKLEKFRNKSANTKAEKDFLDKRIKFLNENSLCPSCEQAIDDTHKEKHKLEFQGKYEKIKNTSKTLLNVKKWLDEQFIIISENGNKLAAIDQQRHEYRFKINNLTNKKNSLLEDIKRHDRQEAISDKTTEDLNVLKEAQVQLNIEKNTFLKDYEIMNSAHSLLKDTSGIKTEVIRNYIPVINKIVNKYLILLDLYVNFTLDASFNEVITSTSFKEFSYNSFSEGEKFRIDFALLMAWREIAKLKNSCSCNLLFLDETLDSSLDMSGGDAANRLINDLTNDGISVFVISHRDVMIDNFNNSITVNKAKGFSYIVENKS